MRSALRPDRGSPVLKRIASVTAGALCATLLTPTGAATAQSDVDCTTLGDDPMANTLANALDTAVACGVEVRVRPRSSPYSTVYATPQGQLHLVGTSDPVQGLEDIGPADPTLEVWEGSLVQKVSDWYFFLRYDDTAYPLLETQNASLDWNGELPVPTFADTTAVYDEIAEGLDLAVDVDVASAGLRFTAADTEAWNALASGLTVIAGQGMRAVDGSLFLQRDGVPPAHLEWTTPFTVRDAEGVVTRVDLTLDDDGALTASLPEGLLDTAAFPLEMSTQWTYQHYLIADWGSVTSAEPDLAVFRGEAGLDSPYFRSAGETGDAIVGPYCDALAAPACATTHEAESFWHFRWPEIEGLRPSQSHEFAFPLASATFRVDAAEGTACVAPELRLTGRYTPMEVWSDRPDARGVAGSGGCQDGSAIYDVTESVADAWETEHSVSTVTFGMVDSAETARFDGGSGRWDVYFDIVGFDYTAPNRDVCGPYTQSVPFYDSTPTYGAFSADVWRSDAIDHGLTWTATFSDADSGEAVLTTDPRPVDPGSNTTSELTAEEALNDGRYLVVYRFSNADSSFEYQSTPCYIGVDTVDPQFLDIAIEPGPHHVGDTVEVDISVADADYPDGWNTLTIRCMGGDVCGSTASVSLRDGTTTTWRTEVDSTAEQLMFRLADRAGNHVYSQVVDIPATHANSDFNGDGEADLMAERKSDGYLMFYEGLGDGTFADGTALGPGWGRMDVVIAGDLTGDGTPDLLARNTANGYLYTYPGDGAGSVTSRITVGGGWNSMSVFTSADDFDRDGNLDLLAVRKYDGKLYLYPGRGDGTFGSRTALDDGWNVMDTLTTVGDVDRDGRQDFLARDSRTGTYYIYLGSPIFAFGERMAVHASLDGEDTRRYSQVAAVGDLDGDGVGDVVGVDSKTGELVLHSFDDDAAPLHAGRVVGTSWGAFKLPTAASDRTYDYDGNGGTDIIARKASDGTLSLYRGNGSGGFISRYSWGPGWNSMNLIETAGDFNGDGKADLLTRKASTGTLFLYPGDGSGDYLPDERVLVATGMNSMSTIIGGHDFDGDGKTDLIAVEASTGYLWLYPGKGTGKVGQPVKIGSGWKSMQELTAVGDLDHDGHADMIAVSRRDGCLYLYSGHGDSTFEPRAELSCGAWLKMDNLAGVGDFDGDGHADWIARRSSDGKVVLYSGNGNGEILSRTAIRSWNSMNAIA